MSSLELAFIGMPGGSEWIVILIVALLLFGKRLPDIMRGVGASMHEFRSAMNGDPERGEQNAARPTPDQPASPVHSALGPPPGQVARAPVEPTPPEPVEAPASETAGSDPAPEQEPRT
jgi:sec-independent protein translocase protein TatA